jgi:hypothetical protein
VSGRHGPVLGATALVVALTALVTWPQALHLSSRLAPHADAQFSIWRLGWIAHALATAPTRLFDANIFFPATGTLAYSDATLLQGLLGAPLLWSGAPPTLVYNLLLLAGFAGSGLAMFVLARHLTGGVGPALVAAAVYTVLPYRIEHFMHLELQWTVFVPLVFWSLHKAVESASVRYGIVAGVCIALQVASCIYYGVFLALLLAFFAPALVLLTARDRVASVTPSIAVAAAVAALLVAPLVVPYLSAARDIGVRPPFEIAKYSASPINYLATPAASRLWGWTADRWGAAELRLFPGLIAVLLACGSLWRRPLRPVVLYGLTTLVAVACSFGVNNRAYALLLDYVHPLQSFRSMSRFAALAECGLAVLAAFGAQALAEQFAVRSQRRAFTVALVLGLIAAEASNRPVALDAASGTAPADVYRVLRSAPYGVVLELPTPRHDALPGWDPAYQAWSLWHYKPLVNGYSGYYPRDYLDTIIRMEVFPSDESMARLRAHQVRYILVHRAFYSAERLENLMRRIAGRPDLKPWGAYKDPVGLADLYEVVN